MNEQLAFAVKGPVACADCGKPVKTYAWSDGRRRCIRCSSILVNMPAEVRDKLRLSV